ncbi:hypothetical protein A5847_002693, partial [Enterococcus faecium]
GLRHNHAIIAKKCTSTLVTYGHLYPNSLREVANNLTGSIQTNFSKIKPTPIYDDKK